MAPSTPSGVRLRATAFTHQGAVRPANEDTIAIGDQVINEPMAAPAAFELEVAQPVLCLVADGMGGHAAGEVASRVVAERLAAQASRTQDEADLANLLVEVDAELFELMRQRPALGGMGTTVAGVAIAPAGSLVFNVGDSRVYRIEASARGGGLDDRRREPAARLEQLSTDDTPGPKLADGRTAEMTSNLITQVLGGTHPESTIEPHLLPMPLSEHERYLICSDGLSDLVPLSALEACLGADDSTSIEALFEAAMNAGGRDNVSIVILDLRRS
jgi:PPM family protein phosphatase